MIRSPANKEVPRPFRQVCSEPPRLSRGGAPRKTPIPPGKITPRRSLRSGAEEPRRGRGKTTGLEDLAERRRKLLELYYADRLSPELFAEEEARLSGQIEAVRREQEEREARLSEVAAKFGVARILREMDIDRLWAEATDRERRVIVEELLESVAMYPDHLEVTVSGVPRLNVTLDEVGLTGGWQFCGVGGARRTSRTPLVVRGELLLAAQSAERFLVDAIRR